MGKPGLADLHRHLDGSLRRSTTEELAGQLGVPVPSPLEFQVGMGIQAALSRFAFTLSLLQTPDAVKRVAGEICQDARAEGVTTLEIRFAPQLHKSAPMEAVVDAALEGINGAAGLVLCVLYGADPATARRFVEMAKHRPGIVGIDLAGAPIPGHEFRLEDYASAFCAAEAAGLGRTVHAGEGRDGREIAVAVEQLRAQRIGHGTTLLDAPGVLELVLKRDVTIEACVTSNLHTHAITAIEKHPLPTWLGHGVSACICTDNTLFSGVTAPQEHEVVQRIPGMTSELTARAVANGHRSAFSRR